jgi:hypothetical protein
VIVGIEGLRAAAGEVIGTSDWRKIFEEEGAPKPVCIAEAIVFYWKAAERVTA